MECVHGVPGHVRVIAVPPLQKGPPGTFLLPVMALNEHALWLVVPGESGNRREDRKVHTRGGGEGILVSRDTHRQTWKPRTQRSRRPVSTETVSCQGTLDGAADVTTNAARRFSPGGVT